MNWAIHVHLGRLLLGMDPIKQRKLCAFCAAQLSESAKQPAPTNLRFVGPVLVRSETNYHVLSLPDRIKVIAGELTDQDCRDFASAVRAEKIPPPIDEWRVDWYFKDEVLNKPAKITESFERAKADPLENVRVTTPKIAARFYAGHGQYTNAISICREGIAANPTDDWNYNLLAWIEATCPDSSLRDGKEAVSVATKACELTHWNGSSWIDTLAAAYAESGDFQRAIECEERAVGTGHPTDSHRDAMQERLALYKESHPYRENVR